MNSDQAKQVMTFLRRVAFATDGPGPTDGELLAQFAASRDEAAFTALMRRHGTMVFSVCRRILRHHQDAEDAFQATFLLLARKAREISDREAVGNWLYGVAYRTALGARTVRARRQEKERQVESMLQAEAQPQRSSSELVEVLDCELSRLPQKYRLPIVLCDLEGRSRKEVAQQLGLPEGTLSSRLATARQKLAKRLSRYGTPVSTVTLGALLAGEASAKVPALLVAATLKTLDGSVSIPVAALTERMARVMLFAKLKVAAWTMVLAASLGAGGVGLAYRTLDQEEQKPNATESKRPHEQAATSEQDPLKLLQQEIAALRAEVEAMRVNLQETRQRLQSLECDVHPATKTEINTAMNDMKRMILALLNYHDVNGCFPPTAIRSKEGKPLLSWRVAILPFIEEQALYQKFKLNEPWDSPNNKKLIEKMPICYRNLRIRDKRPGLTTYLAPVGKEMIFTGAKAGTKILDITDGTSNTIILLDVADDHGVIWTKPDDLSVDLNDPMKGLLGHYADFFLASMADGSIRCVPKTMSAKTLRAAFTRSGGEVNRDW